MPRIFANVQATIGLWVVGNDRFQTRQLVDSAFETLGVVMNPIMIVANFISLYSLLVIIRCLLTWIPSLDFSTQPFRTLSDVTDPYLNLFRGLIPPLGGMDLSPMVAIFALQILGNVINSLSPRFASYANFMVG
jgi:YggT family protein